MLQAFIEFSLLAIGIYALFTGKLPMLLIGTSNKIEPNIARLIGILFVLPLPSLLCIGMVMGILQVDIKQFIFVEPVLMLVVIILGIIFINRYRKPVELSESLNNKNQE